MENNINILKLSPLYTGLYIYIIGKNTNISLISCDMDNNYQKNFFYEKWQAGVIHTYTLNTIINNIVELWIISKNILTEQEHWECLPVENDYYLDMCKRSYLKYY